ncbi:MAG TPA: hypothetical protein VLL48_14955 [Longimicrobiales bacterium]|nr:hypothetical protein [Longimicrobiales bacterium]
MAESRNAPLRAVPTSFFSWDYRVFQGDEEVALVDLAWLRERAWVTVDGEEYRIEREGIARGRWFLRSGDRVLASAEKPSAFRRRFDVTVTDRRFTLEPGAPWSRRFVLRHGARERGFIEPEGLLTRKARIDLPADLSLPVRIFLSFLVLVLWKRAHAAAG